MRQTPKKIPVQVAENKYYMLIMFSAFLICVIALTTYKIEDDDVFWHLATGRFIVENKYVPDKDVFGYTTQNAEWIPFEWGWDVISFSLYGIGGYNALFIFRTLIFCFLFLIYFRLLRKFNINSIISVLLLLALLLAVFNRLSPRPHIFTYLFLTILLYLFLTYKYFDREKYFKRLFFLPVIFLVWGNLHLGTIAGGLLLFIFVVSELLIFYFPSRFSGKDIKPMSKEHLRKLIFISALSALVLLINPHGLNTYIYAYSHTKMKMLESIEEWLSPFAGNVENSLVITLYKIFLFSGIIVLIYAYKKRDLTFALVYLVFLAYSVRAIRFTIDYEIIVLFFLAVSIDHYLKHLFKSNNTANKFLNGNPVKVVITILFVYISYQTFYSDIYLMLKYNRETGLGISSRYFPLELFDFMKQNNIRGTPLNNFESGGLQIWSFPGQNTFIDSRNLNDEIFNEYMSILYMKPGFERKLEQYGMDYVVFFEPRLVKFPNAFKQVVTDYLFKNKNWKLVYWDDKSVLFLKDLPKYSEIISKYEYKVFIPYTAIFNKKEFEVKIKNSQETASNEIKRKADTEPQGYFYLGMKDMALKVLQNKQ